MFSGNEWIIVLGLMFVITCVIAVGTTIVIAEGRSSQRGASLSVHPDRMSTPEPTGTTGRAGTCCTRTRPLPGSSAEHSCSSAGC